MSTSSGSTERAVPFHCPFCGEQDLWPHEVVSDAGEVSSPHGSWECRGCQRAFSLKMLGLLRRSASGPASTGAGEGR
ncbi:MAG: hypothetical protein OSB43_00320 [Nocardioides sp.]|uniref:hypothetical protein n=1 Tax=Nocardioides sp. TaxID=35761 RepID=UPI002388598B|nr:hypothetical protein [Nocardioides sp.]MDE0774702.1 hypothetical protein [Nocardioides sp.]